MAESLRKYAPGHDPEPAESPTAAPAGVTIAAATITSAVRADLDLPGSGIWISQPWRFFAFGFLYFTATGISELFGHRWLRGTEPRR